MHELKVLPTGPYTFINISPKCDINDYLSKTYNLPLNHYYLERAQINKILEKHFWCFLQDFEYYIEERDSKVRLYNETKSWQRQIAVSSSWMPILVDFKTKIGIFTLLNSKLSKDFVRMSLFFFQIGWKLLIPVWNVVHKGYSKTVVSFLAKTTGMIAHRNFHHPPDKYPSFESSFLSFFKSDFWIGPGMVKNRPRAWPMDRLDLFSHSIA